MITNIQLLRALAALSVIWYHLNFLINGTAHTDFQGVCLFFVISGYIITLVSQKKPENFLAHRFIRIVPMYWFAILSFIIFNYFLPPHRRLIILCLLPLLLGPKLNRSLGGKWKILDYTPYILLPLFLFYMLKSFTSHNFANYADHYFSLSQLVTSFLFIPAKDINGDLHPLLGVGWTLNIEIFFYLTFGLMMFINRRYAPLLTSLVLIGFRLYQSAIGCASDYCNLYSHDYTLYFILGIAVYYVHEQLGKYSVHRSKLFAVAALIMSLAGLVLVNLIPHDLGPVFSFLNYTLPTWVVFSALWCHSAGLRSTNGFLILLGNASYSAYLLHATVLETVRLYFIGKNMPFYETSISALVITVVLSLTTALTCYLVIELPLLKRMKKYVDGRKSLKPVRIAPAI